MSKFSLKKLFQNSKPNYIHYSNHYCKETLHFCKGANEKKGIKHEGLPAFLTAIGYFHSDIPTKICLPPCNTLLLHYVDKHFILIFSLLLRNVKQKQCFSPLCFIIAVMSAENADISLLSSPPLCSFVSYMKSKLLQQANILVLK